MKNVGMNYFGDYAPEYAHHGDAGADVFAAHDLVILPGQGGIVGTKVRLVIPEGYFVAVCSKSGLASRGIRVENSPGVIDSSYRGELKVILWNDNQSSTESHIVRKGDKIAQLLLLPVVQMNFIEMDNEEFEALETTRGIGGFGSTGIRRAS